MAMTQGNDEPDLPICPSNIEFFPQNLPMHCRMARSSDLGNGLPNIPTVMPPLPPGFQSPPPDGQPAPIPIPFPPVSGGLPMPGPMPGPLPGSMMGPMSPGMPMAMPGPMVGPMPMASMGGPNHKLPVIVMPFYSPDPGYKKKPDERPRFPPKKRRRRPKKPLYRESSTDSDDTSSEDSDTDTSTDTSSDHETWRGLRKGWRKNAKNTRRSSRRRYKKKKKELLTPVLQYITRDGYVIFEKKITKVEASDWLKTGDSNSKRENKNDNNKPEKNEQNDEDNDNEDNKKDVENTTAEPQIRPERHRQSHSEGKKLNYEQI